MKQLLIKYMFKKYICKTQKWKLDKKSNTFEKSCLFLLYITSQVSIKKKKKAIIYTEKLYTQKNLTYYFRYIKP